MARFRRALDLQERDLDILESLFECRVMKLQHIAEFHFSGQKEAAKKRVQKLKTENYLRERARRIGDPSILHIAPKGIAALREHGRLHRFSHLIASASGKRSSVSDLTLRHELEVMNVRAVFFRAVREDAGLSITEFATWPALYQFATEHESSKQPKRKLVLKPDGFIRIHEKASNGVVEHRFFLEVDRSTESHATIVQKANCYLRYYQSGRFAERCGGKQEDYKRFPFRVLLVCQTDKRKKNIAESLLRNVPPILTMVWLTTKQELEVTPFGTVWMRPKDFPEGGLRLLFQAGPDNGDDSAGRFRSKL